MAASGHRDPLLIQCRRRLNVAQRLNFKLTRNKHSPPVPERLTGPIER